MSVEPLDDPSELASPVLEVSAAPVLPSLLLPSLPLVSLVLVLDVGVAELSLLGSVALFGPLPSGSTDVAGSSCPPSSDGPELVSAETAGSSAAQPMIDNTTIVVRTCMLATPFHRAQ